MQSTSSESQVVKIRSFFVKTVGNESIIDELKVSRAKFYQYARKDAGTSVGI